MPKGIKVEIFKANPIKEVEEGVEMEDMEMEAGEEMMEAENEAKLMFDSIIERYLSYEGEEKAIFEQSMDDFIQQYQDLKMAE